MKLYVMPVAPNPTRVRLYVAEKNAAGARIDVTEIRINLVKGEQNAAEHLARNPFGRVPVLELPDGTYLGESLAIIEYLEECYPSPPLIGSEPLERARTRELERIAEMGVLQPVARIVHATNSPRPRSSVISLSGDKGVRLGQNAITCHKSLKYGFSYERQRRVATTGTLHGARSYPRALRPHRRASTRRLGRERHKNRGPGRYR